MTDIIDRADAFMRRHRSFVAAAAPLLETEDDGIPVLTDVVGDDELLGLRLAGAHNLRSVGELEALEREMRAQLEAEFAARLERELAACLEQEYATRLEQDVAAGVEQALPARIEEELGRRLPEAVAARVEQDLPERLERELAAQLPQAVEDKLVTLLPQRLVEELAARVPNEVEARFAEELPRRLNQTLTALAPQVHAILENWFRIALPQLVSKELDAAAQRIAQQASEQFGRSIQAKVDELLENRPAQSPG